MNAEALSLLEFRRRLESQARAAFAALVADTDDVMTTLYTEAPAAQVAVLRQYDVGGLDALGKATLAIDVALALGSVTALKGGLLMPALRPSECLLLLVADNNRAEAVLADVSRAPLAVADWTEPTERCEGLFVDALAAGLKRPPCPDCGARVGAAHRRGCDIARCVSCGGQRLSCDCDDSEGERWSGQWPGVFECRALDWYARRAASGWVPCSADTAGARPDLNRLAFFAAHGYDGLYD